MSRTDVYAIFSLGHPDLDPDNVSQRLGITPTSSHKRGDVLKKYRWCRGAWNYSTKSIESEEFQVHLDALLDTIAPRADQIRELFAQGFDAELSCYSSADDGQAVIQFSPRHIDLLQLIGLGATIVANRVHADELAENVRNVLDG